MTRHGSWGPLVLLLAVSWATLGSADEKRSRESAMAVPVRTVMKAMVAAAETNQKLPPVRPILLASGQYRRDKDELTELLFRRGAAAAKELPPEVAAKAFLLALGLTIDDSTILRSLPGFSSFCTEVEPDQQRRARLAVLGQPTMRGRRDSAQHFVVSAALVAWVGVAGAETAGLAKEMKDAIHGTGFSFVDLSSDLSGTTFAVAVQENRLSLARLAESFAVTDVLPNPAGLREGYSWAEFTKLYGSLDDERFRRQVDAIRERIRALPCYRSPK